MKKSKPFAHVVISRSPLAPSEDVSKHAIARAVTLQSLVDRYRIGANGLPFVCSIAGEYYSRKEWPTRRVRRGEHVVFRSVLQFGGGSNPLNIVLQAVMAAATGGGSIWAQIGTFALNMVKGIAVNALLNLFIASPKQPAAAANRAMAAPSPTYSLQAQGNTARLGQPIPVLFGRMRVFPDYGADPYAEYLSNEQYLYQLFVVSQGQVAIERLNIGDTEVTGTLGPDGIYTSDSPFEGVSWQIVPPEGEVTLFPANVSTSGEVAGQVAEHGVTLGPFPVNPAGSVITRIGYDLVCPRGLYYFKDDGGMESRTATFSVDARPIDDSGVALGPWVQIGTHSVTAQTNTPQRRSYSTNVEAGRYEVRLTRTNAPEASTRGSSELAWAGLRGYHPGSLSYGGVTMLAMVIRATGQITEQSARRVNLVAQRLLPVWSAGTGWSTPQITRNPAWAIAEMARAQYGGRLADSRIELDTLADLALVWAARGDEYNAYHDARQTLWEALTLAARVGRAAPYTQYGRLFVVRDGPQSMPAMLFSDRSIVRGSMRVRYIVHSSETADAVEVEYLDDTTWGDDRVLAKLPDSSAEQPATVKLFGCTNRLQAWREGMHTAASNRYRRQLITFATGEEGLIPRPGTLCAIQHRRPRWGQSGGDLVAWSGDDGAGGVLAGGVLTLERPVTFVDGSPHFVAFRGRRGEMRGHFEVTAGADEYHLVLAEPVAGWQPYVGASGERAHVVFGHSSMLWRLARLVTPIRPRTDSVELTFVTEADEVHEADGGLPPATDPVFELPVVPDVPSIPGGLLLVPSGSTELPTLAVSWAGAAGASVYQVEHSYDGAAWSRVADTTSPTAIFNVLPGLSYVRVRPVGRSEGAWVSASVSVHGGQDTAAPAQPAEMTASAFQTVILLEWPAHNRPDIRYVEIWRGTTNNIGSAESLVVLPGSARRYPDPLGVSGAQRWYWYRLINTRGEPGAFSIAASATTTAVGGVPVVANVPTSNMGDLVYVRNDESLYEWNGVSAYERAQPLVAANRIVAGTISVALTLQAASITGGSLNIANRFIVGSDGAATIRSSASTTAGLTLNSSGLYIRDDAQNLIVELGELS